MTTRMILLILLLVGVASCTQRSSPPPSTAEAVPPNYTPEQVAQSLAILQSEGQKGKERFAALDVVRASAPYLSEFLRLYPNAEVNYRYFASRDEPGFDVGVDLYDRYEFRMQLPVHFDSERRRVVGYGDPKFVIWEVDSVTTSPSGTAETSFVSAGERHFGSAEWHTLVAHGGDFSAIGYNMQTNRPVKGFRDRNSQP